MNYENKNENNNENKNYQMHKDPLSLPLTKGSLSYALKCQAHWWRRNTTTVILFWDIAKESFVWHAEKSDTPLFQGKRVGTIEQTWLSFHGRQCTSRCMQNNDKGTETLTGVAIPESKNYAKSSSSVSCTCLLQ